MFLNLQKNKIQKQSMLKEKQRQFWNLYWIPHKTIDLDFQFSGLIIFAGKVPKEHIFGNTGSAVWKSSIVKKIENLDL